MLNKFSFLLCSAMCIVLSACRKTETVGGVSQAIPTTDKWVHGIGYVEPTGEVRRLAFKHPGVIAECRVEIGQKVRKGELLMRLGDEEERAAEIEAEAMVELAKSSQAQTLAGVNPPKIRAQRALLESAKLGAAYAKLEHERRQGSSSAARVFPQSERDQMEMAMKQKAALVRESLADLELLENMVRDEDRAVMESKVKHAEAQLIKARSRSAAMELRAPFDGTVLEILQREGNASHSVFPEPVILFADLTKLRARGEIVESYALWLKEGQAALLTTQDENRTEITGTVRLVKQVMGKKTVFSKTATERKDLDVLQVLIDLPTGVNLPIGLEMDVRINTQALQESPPKR